MAFGCAGQWNSWVKLWSDIKDFSEADLIAFVLNNLVLNYINMYYYIIETCAIKSWQIQDLLYWIQYLSMCSLLLSLFPVLPPKPIYFFFLYALFLFFFLFFWPSSHPLVSALVALLLSSWCFWQCLIAALSKFGSDPSILGPLFKLHVELCQGTSMYM